MFSLRRVIYSFTKTASISIKPVIRNNICVKQLKQQLNYIGQYRMCSKINYAENKDENHKDEELEINNAGNKLLKLGQLEVKLKLYFTCKKCNTRNHKVISKLAYEKGVVIVRCDGCKNNHLIADNMRWFTEWEGVRNIEQCLKMKGENVFRIRNNVEGYFEAITREEIHKSQEEQKAIKLKHKLNNDEEV